MLSEILESLEDAFGFTQEEISAIREKLIEFGTAVILDSNVRKELDDVEEK